MTLRTNALLTMYIEVCNSGMTNAAVAMLKDDKRLLKPYGTWDCTRKGARRTVLDWATYVVINYTNIECRTYIAVINEVVTSYHMKPTVQPIADLWHVGCRADISKMVETSRKIEPLVGRILFTPLEAGSQLASSGSGSLYETYDSKLSTVQHAISELTVDMAEFIYDRYTSNDCIKILLDEIISQNADTI